MTASFGTVELAALVAAGVAAGFINTMAGGGSMLTLPALMLVGLPADVANGSNRLSIVSQSVSGAWSFRRRGLIAPGAVAGVVAPTAVGALLGALGASRVPASALRPVLLTTMVAVAIAMVLRPMGTGDGADAAPLPPARGWPGLFVAGLYGGFIQAGVGFVLLAVLGSVLRYDVLRANALKLVCTTFFGAVALTVFALVGQVAWAPAAVLAVATVLGSQLGVRFALRVDKRVIRIFVLAAVVISSAVLLLRAPGP